MTSARYFAFGSNTLSARLQARTPSARPQGLAELPGWRLALHKRGADGSGKGDIVPGAPGERVLGVVFSLDAAELETLDRFEGAGYARTRVEVRLGAAGAPVSCIAYRAEPGWADPALAPFDWYHRLILAGLLEHGAEPAYIDALRAAPRRRDPLPWRPARRKALAALRTFAHQQPERAALLGG